MNLLSTLKEAMRGDSPTDSFRAAVKAELDAGINREILISELTTLRGVVDESEEDVILEILDFLHGWCAPHQRL